MFTIWCANPGEQLNVSLGLMGVTELCPWFVPNTAHGAGGNVRPRHGWEDGFGNPTNTQAKLSVVGRIERDNFPGFSYREVTLTVLAIPPSPKVLKITQFQASRRTRGLL